MKHLSAIIAFLLLAFSSQAQKKAYIKDTLIGHYVENGKLQKPLESVGKYHKKTKRKKGKWVEFAVVSDFEYRISPKTKEPEQVFAQYIEKAEGEYKDGKRVGVWTFYLIEYGSLTPRKYKTETFVEGVKEGPFKYFFVNGKPGVEGKNVEGEYSGPVNSFYADGSKYGLRIYKEGKATGKHVYYFRDGTTKLVLFYLNDKRHGPQKTFYPGGVLKEEYVNKNGKADGLYRFYHPNGQLWVEKIYQQNLLVNVTKLLDSEGNALEVGDFKNGNGKLNFYNSEGKVYAIKTYQNGVKVHTQLIQ